MGCWYNAAFRIFFCFCQPRLTQSLNSEIQRCARLLREPLGFIDGAGFEPRASEERSIHSTATTWPFYYYCNPAIFFYFCLVQAFFDVFPQLSPTQVGETLSFSENSLSFSKKPLSLFERMEDFFQNSLIFTDFKLSLE